MSGNYFLSSSNENILFSQCTVTNEHFRFTVFIESNFLRYAMNISARLTKLFIHSCFFYHFSPNAFIQKCLTFRHGECTCRSISGNVMESSYGPSPSLGFHGCSVKQCACQVWRRRVNGQKEWRGGGITGHWDTREETCLMKLKEGWAHQGKSDGITSVEGSGN